MGDKALQMEVEEEVHNLVGCDNMKAYFKKIQEQAKYVERGGNIKILHTSLHMRITGNPGTGKTTCARLIAKYLHAYGVLASNRFINMNALELKGQYVGQTAPRVIEAVQNALGGCLFLGKSFFDLNV